MNRSPEAPPQLLLTSLEAAKVLSISPRKLWELTNRREIPAIRIGRAVRYKLCDLEKWVADQRPEGR